MKGTRIIKTKVSKTHCVEATLIWCIDTRFRKAMWDLEKALGFNQVDVIKVAGGGKSLAGNGYCKKFLLGQVDASVRFHDPKKIVVMFHHDCRAYKPLKLNGLTEREFLLGEARKAKEALQEFKLPVSIALVDFGKIHLIQV